MSKEKSKSRGLPTRRFLMVAVLLMALICVVALLRPVVWPFFYRSRDIPHSQRYRLTGESYLSQWREDQTDAVKVTLTDNVRRSNFRKNFSGDVDLWAEITFAYYDTVYFADGLYEEKALRHYPWAEAYYDYVVIDTLRADKFRVGCNDMFDKKGCTFVGQYGSCIIAVYSRVMEPYVTPDDYKHLIEDYIDPQMAAWDVCYAV